MADDYAAFADYYASLEGADEGMNLTDPLKNVAADVVGTGAAAATAGQVAAEQANMPNAAKIMRGVSMLGHNAQEYVESGISEAGKKARDAALIPEEGQEQLLSHPGREAAMKTSSVVVPALFGMIGEAVNPAGGAIAAGSVYQIAHGIDQAVGWTNKMNDEQLEQAAPVFGKFKRMYLEDYANSGMAPEEAEKRASDNARADLHDGLYSIKGASILRDAVGGAVTFGAGKKVLQGSIGNRAVDYVLTGGAMGTGAALSDINAQEAENAKTGKQGFDPNRTLINFLNGTAEGLAFEGAGHAAHKLLGRMPKEEPKADEPAREMSPDLFNQQTAAPSTGAAPKTTRADTQPPPKTDVEVGDPQNKPRADGESAATAGAKPAAGAGVGPAGEAIKAKKGKAEPQVPEAPATGPDAAETQALRDSTGGAPTEVNLAASQPSVDVTKIMSPEPRPEPGAPVAEAAPVDVTKIVSPEPAPAAAAAAAPVTETPTVPEAGPTLQEQRKQLVNGERVAMVYKPGDVGSKGPPPKGKKRFTDDQGNIWHYDPAQVTPEVIKERVAAGRQNELTNLGPFNKADVAADVAAGAEPTAVVARTPEGTEVAAAASTDRLAPKTAEAMAAANPGTQVRVENPQGVLDGRAAGTGKVQPTGRILEAKLTPEEQARIDAAEQALAARRAAEAKKSEQIARRVEEKPEVVQGERRSKDTKRVAAAAENAKKAQAAFEAHAPTEAESALTREGATPEEKAAARAAILERARRAVEMATKAGYEIPKFIRNHTAAEKFISNAARLVRAYGKSKAEKLGDKVFVEFQISEKLQRGSAEDFKVDLQKTRGDNDLKFQKKTSDLPVETTEEVGSVTGAKIDSKSETRIIKDKDGNPIKVEAQQAADPGRVLSKAERDALAAQYNTGPRAAPKTEPAPKAETSDVRPLPKGLAEINVYHPGDKKMPGSNIEFENPIDKALYVGHTPSYRGHVDRNKALNYLDKTTDYPYDEARENSAALRAYIDRMARKAGPYKAAEPRTLRVPESWWKEEEQRRADFEKARQARSFEDDDFARAFFAAEQEGRETGEREGHVSSEYGSGAAAAPIIRTAKVRDIFEKSVPAKTGNAMFDQLFNNIRSKLIDVAGDIDVHYVSAEDMAAIHKDGARAQGFYKEKAQGEGGYIVLRDDIPRDRLAHVFTHEALHAATSDALSSSSRLTGQVKSIMAEVKRAFPDEIKRYGFKDEHEFIAEAFSNAEFQDLLARTKVSRELAKALGMPELRAQSLWRAMVQIVRNALNLPRGSYSALEAVMRPTMEAMDMRTEGRGNVRSFTLDDLRGMAGRGGVDAASIGRRVKRAASTITMIAHSAAKYGERFGEHARRAAELSQRMDVMRSKILEREGGGLEIAQEAADLVRRHHDDFKEATDLGFEATEYNIDPTKDDAWHQKHLGKDATKGWQSKERLKDARARFEALQRKNPEVANWLIKAANFGREEGNAQSKELIKNVLEAADVYTPELADRIFENGVTEADEALFKTNKIVQHLNQIAGLKRMQGWYFPLMREGDYVVTGRREFDTPEGKHVTRISNDTVQFMDPKGVSKGKDSARARRAAENFVKGSELRHIETELVHVDVNDPTKLIDPSDVNARPAYRVKMQDQYMSMHASESEAIEAAGDLQKQGYADVKQDIRRQNPNARWGGFMPSQFETMVRSLAGRQKFKDMTEVEQNELIQAMRQASIKLLPGARLQHRNLQRKGVAGYSTDMVNSISRYAQQSAAYRARLEFQPQIDKALRAMHEDIEGSYDKDTIKRREIYRELETRLYRGQEFEAPKAWEKPLRVLNKISMLDKLAGPSFHIINSMEPWTTAAPVIGGRHGFVNSIRTLKAAYNMIGGRGALSAGFRDTAKAFTADAGFTDYRKMFQNEIATNISGERGRRLNDLLDHLHDLNLFGHEAGMEVHRLANPAETAAGRALDRAELVSRQVGQAIEAINRAVTGLSAYELEFKRNGGNHEAAKMYAHDVVHDTMGNYAASNAAPIFNNPLGKSALQFKKFAQKTYYLLGKMAVNAYHGDREAMKQFAGVMFTHGVLAGALGMPLEPIKIAMITSNALGVSPYTYDDFENAIRETAADLFGKTGGMAVTRGLPRALLGVDLASRVGMESLLTFGKPLSNKTADMKSYLFDTIAGAPLGMVFKGITGVQSVAKGDVQGAVDNLIPIKFARDIGRAGFGYAGGKLDRNGRQLMEPYTAYEAGVQALGFTPTRKAESYEERSVVREGSYGRTGDRREAINNYVNAAPADRTKAWAAVQKFNRGVPRDAQITMNQLQSELKKRRTEKAEGKYDRGMRIGKQNRDIYERAQRVYGGQ